MSEQGQKCPKCGRPTVAIGEFTLFESQSHDLIYVRKWTGVDCGCDMCYLEILSTHMAREVKSNE